MTRPTKILIDTRALLNNVEVARELSPQASLVAVVKANAYGHGAIELAPVLEPRINLFAVSCCEEAMALRQVGCTKPVVLLEGCFDQQEWQLAHQQNFEPAIHDETQLTSLFDWQKDGNLRVWLKIDTGMNRLGFMPDRAVELYQKLMSHHAVREVVVMTHFASADEADPTFTEMQLSRFDNVLEAFHENRISPPLSMANSACLLKWPQTRKQFNRPGFMLYGLTPFGFAHPEASKLKPVMSFESSVIAVREIMPGEAVGYGNTWRAKRHSVIATVAAGYGDGYPRTAKSGTPVLINGKRAQLAGRVSMDMITVDVTDHDSVKVGDPCVLWGKELSANEVAQWAGTIGYELVTRLPPRVPRTFI